MHKSGRSFYISYYILHQAHKLTAVQIFLILSFPFFADLVAELT